jgi:ribosome biogenesis GTPase
VLQKELSTYHQIGYRILLTSVTDDRGIDEARQALAGHISILMGKSGVGKTSLLNAIQPGLGLKVSEVSKGDIGKGRHTTTTMEMFPLNAGGAVVDTPGMRSYTLWDVDSFQLAEMFPEMRPYLRQCQFKSNCQHEHEPNCAVRKAVTAGKISPRRYQSYLKLLHE